MTPDYKAALQDLHTAQQQFEQADPDHIDIAIHRLKAAELRFDQVVKEVRDEAR